MVTTAAAAHNPSTRPHPCAPCHARAATCRVRRTPLLWRHLKTRYYLYLKHILPSLSPSPALCARQVRLLRRARVFISLFGSALHNCRLLHEGALVLELHGALRNDVGRAPHARPHATPHPLGRAPHARPHATPHPLGRAPHTHMPPRPHPLGRAPRAHMPNLTPLGRAPHAHMPRPTLWAVRHTPTCHRGPNLCAVRHKPTISHTCHTPQDTCHNTMRPTSPFRHPVSTATCRLISHVRVQGVTGTSTATSAAMPSVCARRVTPRAAPAPSAPMITPLRPSMRPRSPSDFTRRAWHAQNARRLRERRWTMRTRRGRGRGCVLRSARSRG
eukprot:5641632-Prymnesium_polylepis.3